jgi:hypothetical protein
MAFDPLYKHTDELKNRYHKCVERGQHGTAMEVLFIMTDFYETLKGIPKFKDQRDYTRRMIAECNSAYAKGYFKRIL